MNLRSLVILLSFGASIFLFGACEKENDLEEVVLYNPFEQNNGVELLEIDSVKKTYGPTNVLKTYFHINEEHFTSINEIHRVIVYRNGIERARLTPGNFATFSDISVSVGYTYSYEMSLLMKDSTYTKKSTSYLIVF